MLIFVEVTYLTTTAGSTGGYVTLEYLTNDHIPWQCTLCSQTRSQVHCTFFLVEARNSLGNNQGLATAAGNPVHYCHWTFSQLHQNQIPKILQLFSVVWVPSLYAIQKMRLHNDIISYDPFYQNFVEPFVLNILIQTIWNWILLDFNC